MKPVGFLAIWIVAPLGLTFWASIASAVPASTSEQIRACTNAVVLELNGVPRSEIMTTAGSVEADGSGRVNWEVRDGRFGFCQIAQGNQVVDFEVENSQIIHPPVFDHAVSAAAGAGVIVATDGGGVNVRSSPGGEIKGTVANGSALILTGQANGEWVEIEGGGWISRYLLAASDAPIAAADGVPDIIPLKTSERSEDPDPLEQEATLAESNVAAGMEALVVGSGGLGLNIRRSPNGEIFASVLDGETVILTGGRDGEWVEIAGGGWVSEAYLQPK